jgi:hypothetical protein
MKKSIFLSNFIWIFNANCLTFVERTTRRKWPRTTTKRSDNAKGTEEEEDDPGGRALGSNGQGERQTGNSAHPNSPGTSMLLPVAL